MMEAKVLSPYTDHPPAVEKKYADNYSIKHGLCAQVKAPLYPPEAVDPNGLSRDPD